MKKQKLLVIALMLFGLALPGLDAFGVPPTRKGEPKTDPDTGEEYVDCTKEGDNCSV